MRKNVFFGTLFLANALVATRFIFSLNQGGENAFWIVLAGFTAFLIPGGAFSLALGSNLNLKQLDLIAKSFLYSMCLWLLLAIPSFIFNFTMAVPCAFILAWNAIWLGFCFRKNLLFQRSSLVQFILFVTAVLMVIFYRAADNVGKIGWETALHITYVREYASGLTLGIGESALRPNLPPSNLFFLWEFMVGAAAYLSGSDALIAALRLRFIFPLLSVASYYFFLRRFLKSSRLALWVTSGVLICAVLQVWDIPPLNGWELPDFHNGNYRGLGSLMPSFHHADTAMEILLPLLVGILFTFIFRPSRRAWIWVLVSWMVAFFWHPREYFQVIVYFPVAALADLIVYGKHRLGRNLVRIYLPLLGGAVVATLVLSTMVTHLLPATTEVNMQWELKTRALNQFLASAAKPSTWLNFQSPLFFSEEGVPNAGDPGEAQKRGWMVLLALSLLPLCWKKPKRYQWLAAFIGVLWFFIIIWVPSQQILCLLTYAEIMISKFRFFSTFAPGLSVLGLLVFFDYFRPGNKRVFGAAALGLAVWWIWFHEWGVHDPLIIFASVVGVVGFALALFRKGIQSWKVSYQPQLLVCLGVFAAVFANQSIKRFWLEVVMSETDVSKNFDDGNVLGLSKDFVSHLRANVPPRSMIKVQPDGQRTPIGVYAPIYVTPLSGSVQQDMPEMKLYEDGKHPIYLHDGQSEDTRVAAEVDPLIIEMLRRQNVNYIYGRHANVERLKNLASRHADLFAIDFVERNNQDILLRVLPVRATE